MSVCIYLSQTIDDDDDDKNLKCCSTTKIENHGSLLGIKSGPGEIKQHYDGDDDGDDEDNDDDINDDDIDGDDGTVVVDDDSDNDPD